MPFKDVVDSSQLSMLRDVLNEFCAEQRIEDAKARDDAATLTLTLFHSGVHSRRALAEALRERYQMRLRQPATAQA